MYGNACADGHNNLNAADRNYCDFLLAVYLYANFHYVGQSDPLYERLCQSMLYLNRDYNIVDPDDYVRLLTPKYTENILNKFIVLYNNNEHGGIDRDIAIREFRNYFGKNA